MDICLIDLSGLKFSSDLLTIYCPVEFSYNPKAPSYKAFKYNPKTPALAHLLNTTLGPPNIDFWGDKNISM